MAKAAPRLGSQSPTFEKVGGYASTAGPAAVAMFGAYGVRFYPSQEHELGLYLARNAAGEPASMTIGLSKPRQNGKSFAARHYAIWCACVLGKAVLYTAHNGGTSRKMFKLIKDFVEQAPDFRKLLARSGGIQKSRGEEAVRFANGGSVEFDTRTAAGARGGTYDVIIVDEAQELTDEQADALTPTTIASESGMPQMIYIGTPPGPKCAGTVFRRMHDAAHAGEGNAWWLEWAVDRLVDPNDRENWYRCCPAMGYRIKESVMADAVDKYAGNPDGFCRELLGWWDSRAVKSRPAFAPGTWEKCRRDAPDVATEGDVSFGVKFSPDGGKCAVAACRRPEEGLPHVELVDVTEDEFNVTALAAWLNERRKTCAQITVDGKAWAPALVETMTAQMPDKGKRRQIVQPRPTEVGAACQMLVDAAANGAVTHIEEPQLDVPVERAVRRPIGQSGSWGLAVPDADATAVEAAALAYWGAMTTKRRPGRKTLCG